MGGQFYPGKDKKRRHLRKRTLWYKLFCSSRWKQVVSFFLVLYVAWWHALVPLTEWLMQVGQTLSTPKAPVTGDWLQYDKDLLVPNLANEKTNAIQAMSERSRLQFGSENRHEKLLSILEVIVPEWFHRNDPEDAENDETEEQTTTTTTNKKQQKLPADKNPNERMDKRSNTTNRLRVDEIIKVQGERTTVRTLHTAADVVDANHTSCPSHLLDSDVETTLIIQTSMDRLWIVNETCKRWKDPIVVVVFVPALETTEAIDEFWKSASCPNIKLIRYMGTAKESETRQYPVNHLRNIGLDAVTTSHILTIDVDFVPSEDLHEAIRSTLKELDAHRLLKREILPGQDWQALVVPAFERKPPEPCEKKSDCAAYLHKNSSFLPHSFEELRSCYLAKDCIVFQSDVNWEGHYDTRSEDWLERKWYVEDGENRELNTIKCFQTSRYEPYVVLRWCPSATASSPKPVAPYYDERFYGYGKNKIQLISHIGALGYQFSILPEGFVVHNPHPESAVKETWNDRKGSDLHSAMDKLYPKFLKELRMKYEHFSNSTIPFCKLKQTDSVDK
jgi:hypothetical protein